MTGGAPPDLLAEAIWDCTSCAPGAPEPTTGWVPATVPGTAASALRAAGDVAVLLRDYDAQDWWFRGRFALDVKDNGPYLLSLHGVSTIADVLLDGAHLLHSENMFATHHLDMAIAPGEHQLLIRCSALRPLLERRRPRPRWKSRELVHQNLRWYRTSLVGRQTGGVTAPAPVGPWRPVTLTRTTPTTPVATRLVASYDDATGGRLDVAFDLGAADVANGVMVEVAGRSVALAVTAESGTSVAWGQVAIPDAEPWWPHTHGTPRLYDVSLSVSGTKHHIARVGFRSVAADRTDGAFAVTVNGTPVFCRGVCWTPLDPVTLSSTEGDLRQALLRIKDAGLNLVRVTGVGVYESDDFYDLCDELGILLWQDCMFAFFDAPDDPSFRTEVEAELRGLLRRLQGRPSLAVLCGGSENEQQAAYLGLPPDRWAAPIAMDLIPRLVDAVVPGTIYVRSTPGESPLPSMVNSGPGHYFGVGAYLAPLEDARRAQVRFASECLSFANPAETLDTPEGISVARGIGHTPQWKAGIHRDANTTWDLEDVRDWYTKVLFEVDPTYLRRVDGERAHLLARATVAAVFEAVLAEWRRPGSPCRGAVVLESHDVALGGGLGVVDGLGRPKSSWYVMRRLMRPSVVLWSGEGVNGVGLHIVSDRQAPWVATVRLDALIDGAVVGDSVEVEATVIDGAASIETATVFGGFRDLSGVHRFGPPAFDVFVATLCDENGQELSRAVHLPGQRLRPVEPDLGLRAVLEAGEGTARVTLTTQRFAQWVCFDLAGWYARDAWFHVVPGVPVGVDLIPMTANPSPPRGAVTAVNAAHPVRLERADPPSGQSSQR